MATASDGRFVVVWHSEGSGGTDTSEYSIQAQRYASDGTAEGGEFQVNTYTTDRQYFPAVAMESDGDFVVVWQSNGSAGTDSSYRSVHGQRFASDGSTVGVEFQVNTYTTSNQAQPTVAVDANGHFVVAWSSWGSAGTDSSEYSVQGQRFGGVFADGFESGDLSAWSNSVS